MEDDLGEGAEGLWDVAGVSDEENLDRGEVVRGTGARRQEGLEGRAEGGGSGGATSRVAGKGENGGEGAPRGLEDGRRA